jgi:hypothetical protein
VAGPATAPPNPADATWRAGAVAELDDAAPNPAVATVFGAVRVWVGATALNVPVSVTVLRGADFSAAAWENSPTWTANLGFGFTEVVSRPPNSPV